MRRVGSSISYRPPLSVEAGVLPFLPGSPLRRGLALARSGDSTNRNEGRSCVFDCSHVELCQAGFHGDFPAEVRALLHHESRTYEIALDGASSTNLNLLTGRDAADDRAEDSHHLRNDVGLDVGIGTNSERVIGQVNSTLHPTINRQVF